MAGEEYAELLNDLTVFGYDESQPITIFEDAVLDGWNRFRACEELDIEPVVMPFFGNATAAINFVMRTNKRRNLTSQQWAAIAADADELVLALQEETERQQREKQAETQKITQTNSYKELADKKLSASSEVENDSPELTYEIDEHANKTATKLAEQFNTNRSYVNQAAKLKKESPEKFEQLKRGETTFQQIKKEVPKAETEIDTTRFDAHTNNFKLHGGRIAKAAKELLELIDEYETYLYVAKINGKSLSSVIHSQESKKTIGHIAASSSGLRRTELCPLCKGKGCKRCGDVGYIDAQNAEYVRKDIEKGVAVYA